MHYEIASSAIDLLAMTYTLFFVPNNKKNLTNYFRFLDKERGEEIIGLIFLSLFRLSLYHHQFCKQLITGGNHPGVCLVGTLGGDHANKF